MKDYNIYFKQDNWRVTDFFTVINMLTKTDYFEDIYPGIDKDLVSAESAAYMRIRQSLEDSEIQNGFHLFCSEGSRNRGFLFYLFRDRLAAGADIDTILSELEHMDLSDIAIKLIYHYDNRTKLPMRFYQELCKNKNLLVDYINALDTNKIIRSELLNFIITPSIIMQNVVNVLTKIRHILYRELDAMKDTIDSHIEETRIKIKQNGDRFLSENLKYYTCIIKNRHIQNVYISYQASIPYLSQVYVNNFDLYISVGKQFESKHMLVEQMDSDFVSGQFKPFSDSVRIRVLQHLQTGNYTLSELSLMMYTPPTTLLHHLNIMENENVISREAEGKRNVYTLKKKGFINSIYSLKMFMDCCEFN